jgi:MFS family permease
MQPVTISTGNDSQPAPSSSRHAWYAVTVLMLCYTLSFVDRQILSQLVPFIKRDLGLSDTRIALLQGLTFAIFYTVMGLPIGRMVDSLNRRNIIASGILVWSIFTAACSAARTFFTLFLARIGVGVGEAALNPAAFSSIADHLPKEQLGIGLSVFYMGVYLGSGLSFLIGGFVLDSVAHIQTVTVPILGTIAAWRLTFLVVGIPGLLFALLAMTIREPLRRGLARTREGQVARVSTAQAIVEMRRRWKSLAGISVAMTFQSGCNYALLFWTVSFFQRAYHWTPGQSGRALASIVVIFGCTGQLFGGWLCDRWQKRGLREAALKVSVLSCMTTAVLAVPAFLAPTPWLSIAFMGPAFFALSWPMGPAPAALQVIFPNQVRGLVSALYIFILNIGGQSLGPLMPGVFNDYLFHDEHMLGASMALWLGIACVSMLVLLRATYSPYRRDYDSMHATPAKA